MWFHNDTFLVILLWKGIFYGIEYIPWFFINTHTSRNICRENAVKRPWIQVSCHGVFIVNLHGIFPVKFHRFFHGIFRLHISTGYSRQFHDNISRKFFTACREIQMNIPWKQTLFHDFFTAFSRQIYLLVKDSNPILLKFVDKFICI